MASWCVQFLETTHQWPESDHHRYPGLTFYHWLQSVSMFSLFSFQLTQGYNGTLDDRGRRWNNLWCNLCYTCYRGWLGIHKAKVCYSRRPCHFSYIFVTVSRRKGWMYPIKGSLLKRLGASTVKITWMLRRGLPSLPRSSLIQTDSRSLKGTCQSRGCFLVSQSRKHYDRVTTNLSQNGTSFFRVERWKEEGRDIEVEEMNHPPSVTVATRLSTLR